MDETYAGLLEQATGEWDEDGFHLRAHGSDTGEHHFRVNGTKEARELLAAVEPLREWVAEHDHEYAAYLVASPEERARVLYKAIGSDDPIEAVDPVELLRERADHDRKARRENAS